MQNDTWNIIDALAARFTAHDTERGLSLEEQWTLQVLKISEETGEAAQAVMGARGFNPRKGNSHTWQDAQDEIADVVITGMVSLARMRPDDALGFLHEQLVAKAAKFLPAEQTDPARASS